MFPTVEDACKAAYVLRSDTGARLYPALMPFIFEKAIMLR